MRQPRNHTFFVHRLGYRGVDCEKGFGRGRPGREVVVKMLMFCQKQDVKTPNANTLGVVVAMFWAFLEFDQRLRCPTT
jgi:hypothetical protein